MNDGTVGDPKHIPRENAGLQLGVRRKHPGRAVHHPLDRAHPRGEFVGSRHQAREKLCEAGHDLGSDRVARDSRVGVGRIHARRKLRQDAEGRELIAADTKARPDDTHGRAFELADGEDPSQARGPGSASEAHDERFELVVGVVAGRDEPRAGLLGEQSERAVSVRAGIGLGAARERTDLDGCVKEGDAETGRERSDEVAVGVGFGRGSQVVDDMSQPGEAARGVEGESQRDGIRTARARDEGAAVGIHGARASRERPPAAEHLRDRGISLGEWQSHTTKRTAKVFGGANAVDSRDVPSWGGTGMEAWVWMGLAR